MAKGSSHGFGLIELIVAMTIAAVLLAVGLPSYKKTNDRNALQVAINALRTDLLFARQKAIQSAQPVSFLLNQSVSACGVGVFAWALLLNGNAIKCQPFNSELLSEVTIDITSSTGGIAINKWTYSPNGLATTTEDMVIRLIRINGNEEKQLVVYAGGTPSAD